MYLAGRTQLQIARELGLSTFTVSTDIAAMVAEWQRRAAVDFAAHVAVELQRLSGVETQAWESFEKSCQPKKITSAGKRSDTLGEGSSPTVVTVTTIQRPEGDPRFLALVLKCIDQRSRLLGLYDREKPHDNQPSKCTLEEFVAAHLEPQSPNGNGTTAKVARLIPLRLDPKDRK